MKTPVLAALSTLAFAWTGCALGAADAAIPTYEAHYKVEYEGEERGTSTFSLSYDTARDVYVFSSHTELKGLVARLVAPNPIIERSEFRLADGALQPLSFRYEDGSRKGEDNFTIQFDWQTRKAVVTGEDGRRELDLVPGALDRGTMQVALIRDVASGGAPGRYSLVDEDAVQPYSSNDNGEQTIGTGMGQLAARSFTQQREGSTRSTWLWLAPSLAHVPARIEQRRDGEIRFAFTLTGFTGPRVR